MDINSRPCYNCQTWHTISEQCYEGKDHSAMENNYEEYDGEDGQDIREEEYGYPDDDMDGDAQSALASAGMGTDEDYGYEDRDDDYDHLGIEY